MKIRQKSLSYQKVMQIKRPQRLNPKRPWLLFSTIVRILAWLDLLKVNFKYTFNDQGQLDKGPCLILMNHSSFIDLKIVSKLIYPRPYNIVCTSDGFIGKRWFMRRLGCIPTRKFVTDIGLIRDMSYAFSKGNHVLMYPEASYSFDGCATPLPRKLGVLIKKMGVPVIMIKTEGAFLRDPLYNGLRLRKVDVSANLYCLLNKEEINEKTNEQIEEALDKAFDFDNFAHQLQNKIAVTEPFRAEGLERILYKCPSCNKEGYLVGKGCELTCTHCNKSYYMNEYGQLEAKSGKTHFSHIPDWYKWQRACVKEQLEKGDYLLDTEVKIGMMVDYNAIYMIGEGRLIHNGNGFELTGANGELNYSQSPLSSYGLYADYFWYEIDDVICIGDDKALYYCFPKQKGVVSKTRLAAEELYKLRKKA
ncbi:MAG: 1-acyl-sn-glycerol-3-phosphate acyltransferase [Clostridia bacterium]|nr:1-acyl-sn-glycerol-3-phosphate acyltransferase [Clostridia bacterium]